MSTPAVSSKPSPTDLQIQSIATDAERAARQSTAAAARSQEAIAAGDRAAAAVAAAQADMALVRATTGARLISVLA